MAYQGDPAPKGPAGFENAPLSSDDLERISAEFRPSWELDEAPFTGAGTMSAADVQALQAGGTHVDVRAATRVVSSAFPPTRSVGAVEPAESMVVAAPAVAPPPPPPPVAAQGVQAPQAAQAAQAAQQWAPAPAAPQVYAPVPAATPVAAQPSQAALDAMAATRIIPPRRAPQAPPMRPRVESLGSDMVRLARPSRKPLWLGLGALAVVAAGVGAWASMSPSADKALPSLPAVVTTASHAAPDFPPPPPSDVKATAAPAVTLAPMPTQAATAAAATPAKAAAPPPVPAPQAAPAPVAPRYVAPAPAPRPYVAPTPAPKPAARPKAGGSTIVHDVPF